MSSTDAQGDGSSGQPPAAPPRRRRRRDGVFRVLWVSAYTILIRLSVVIVTVMLFVYFALNSSFVTHHVAALISDTIPGTIDVDQLRFGPAPERISIIGLAIDSPDGERIIAAEHALVELPWWRIVKGLLAGERGMMVHLWKLRAVGLDVRIDNDAQGRLRMSTAFADPDKPPSPEPAAPFHLRVDHIAALGMDYKMDLPGIRVDALDGDFEGGVSMSVVDGQAEMQYETEDLLIAQVGMHLDAYDASGLPQHGTATAQVERMRGNLKTVDLRGVSLDMGPSKIRDGSIKVTWKPILEAVIRHMAFDASTADPFIGGMLGPAFACNPTGEGRLTWRAPVYIDSSMTVRGGGKVSGFQLRDYAGEIKVRMGQDEQEFVGVDANNVVVHGFGGELRAPRLTYRMTPDKRHLVDTKLQLDELSPAEMLGSDPVAMTGAAVGAVEGALSGTGELRVDLGLVKGGKPPIDMVLKLDADLQLARSERALYLQKALPMLYMRGGLKFEMGPERGMVTTMNDMALSAAVRADGRPDRRGKSEWIAADGVVDLKGAGTSLKFEAQVPELRHLLEPFGVKGISGGVSVRKVDVAGSLQRPAVTGEVQARNVHAQGYVVDELRTKVRLEGGQLSLQKLRASLPQGRLEGDFTATIFGDKPGRPPKKRTVSGRNMRVIGLALGPLLRQQGISGYSGMAALSEARFDMDLADPMASMRAGGELDLRDLQVLHQKIRRAETRLDFANQWLKLRDVEVELPPRHALVAVNARGPVITGEVDFALTTKRYSADLDVPPIELSGLGDIRHLKLPLRGEIGGSLSVQGDLRDMALKSDLTVTELAWGEIVIGNADVSLRKVRGEPMTLASKRFFKDLTLLDGSKIIFRRLMPERFTMGLQAARLDPFAMVSMERPGGIKVSLDATSWVNVDLRRGKKLFHIRTELPAGGAMVDPRHGLTPLNNTRPMVVEVHPDRVDIGSTFLAIGRDELELCGSFLYANAAARRKAELQLYAAGTLDVIRVGPLADSMAAMDMRIDIAADPVVAKDPGAKCLTSLRGDRGALRIAGPVDALKPQGVLQLQRSTITPRGMGRDILFSSGGQLVIGTQRNGQLQATIPEEHPIEVRMEDGWLKSWGFVRTQGNALERMDIRLMANDISYLQPKMMSLSASGGLRLTGRNLHKADKDILVRGDVQVTEAAYFANHDRLGMMVSGLAGRQAQGRSESITDRMPWIKDIKLDLGLRGRNVEVLSRFPLVKTDIELRTDMKVAGTVGAPSLDGRVALEPGSIITYSVFKRDFEVTRGTLDFKKTDTKWNQGYLDLSARSVIELEQGVDAAATSTMGIGLSSSGGGAGSDNKVTVTVDASGTLAELMGAAAGGKGFNLKFSSMPPYEQGDIQALIVTGRPLTSGSGGVLGSRATINLLVDDVAEAVTKMLLGSWSPEVSVGFTATGDLNATVRKNIGKAIRLSGEYFSGSDRTETRATLSIRISQDWSMEGLLRHELSSSAAAATGNIYEGKARYKYDLDRLNK